MRCSKWIGTVFLLLGMGGICQPCQAEEERKDSVQSFFQTRQGKQTSTFRFGTVQQELEAHGKAVVSLEFDFGQAALKPEHLPFIDSVTEALRAHPGWKLSIEGHTDSTGNAANNKRLSLLRAETIRDALKAKGIAADRLACAGYGSENPLMPNDNAENRAVNRRVELIRAEATGAQ